MNPDAMLKEALFEAARHLSTPEERRAYLDRACADDPELRQQIQALLELEAPANEFFRDINSFGHGPRNSNLNARPEPHEGSGQGSRTH